jgi:hypothetical protein
MLVTLGVCLGRAVALEWTEVRETSRPPAAPENLEKSLSVVGAKAEAPHMKEVRLSREDGRLGDGLSNSCDVLLPPGPKTVATICRTIIQAHPLFATLSLRCQSTDNTSRYAK